MSDFSKLILSIAFCILAIYLIALSGLIYGEMQKQTQILTYTRITENESRDTLNMIFCRMDTSDELNFIKCVNSY